MFCRKCVSEIPNDSRYCYKCGSSTLDDVEKTELLTEDDHKTNNGYIFSREYWFTWQGRRNRKPYFFIGVILNIISKLLMMASLSIMKTSSVLALVLVAVDLFISYLSIINIGKRLHDMDFSAWYGAVFSVFLLGCSVFFSDSAIILLINFAFGLTLLFIPGTDGDNKYGRNPLADD